MLDILSMLDGWKYVFPYFEEDVPVTDNKYHTYYDTSKTFPTGAIIYAVVVMDTPHFHVKLSTGDTDLHEIDVSGILYGQAPAGFNTPAGLIANVYIPIKETLINYPIPVGNPAYNTATGITVMNTDMFPYKDGIQMQIKVDKPPAIIYESSIGLLNIYDKEAYLKSLQKIYGGKS